MRFDGPPSVVPNELTQLRDSAERTVLDTVGENLDVFVRWPERALLLWPESDRTPPPGKKHKYFNIRHTSKIWRDRFVTRSMDGPTVRPLQPFALLVE